LQHSEEDEPTCDKAFNFDFENYELTKKNLQILMFEQIIVRALLELILHVRFQVIVHVPGMQAYHPEVLEKEKAKGTWTQLPPPPRFPTHPHATPAAATDGKFASVSEDSGSFFPWIVRPLAESGIKASAKK
jgi:hypothetical protein